MVPGDQINQDLMLQRGRFGDRRQSSWHWTTASCIFAVESILIMRTDRMYPRLYVLLLMCAGSQLFGIPQSVQPVLVINPVRSPAGHDWTAVGEMLQSMVPGTVSEPGRVMARDEQTLSSHPFGNLQVDPAVSAAIATSLFPAYSRNKPQFCIAAFP
jgi:hypothetical protein